MTTRNVLAMLAVVAFVAGCNQNTTEAPPAAAPPPAEAPPPEPPPAEPPPPEPAPAPAK